MYGDAEEKERKNLCMSCS